MSEVYWEDGNCYTEENDVPLLMIVKLTLGEELEERTGWDFEYSWSVEEAAEKIGADEDEVRKATEYARNNPQEVHALYRDEQRALGEPESSDEPVMHFPTNSPDSKG
jgi:hypothetical protein